MTVTRSKRNFTKEIVALPDLYDSIPGWRSKRSELAFDIFPMA